MIKKYLEHRQEREAKVIVALTGSLQTLSEIVSKAYDDVTEANVLDCRTIFIGWLDKIRRRWDS